MAESTRSNPPQLPPQPAEELRLAERPVNVGDGERWGSLLLGGGLALLTLQRSLGTLVLLAGATALLSRGLTGHCPLYQRMGVSTVPPSSSPEEPPAVPAADTPPLIELARS
jgi:hypothetical protein